VGKILIPIGGHSFVTDAHAELIRYAKTLGDPLVYLIRDFREWSTWVRGGQRRKPTNIVTTEQVEGFKQLGAEVVEQEPAYVDEDVRLRLLAEAEALVNIYADQLIISRYKILATSFLLRRWARLESNPGFSHYNIDAILNGPDILGFFRKSVGKLLGGVPYVIMPKIIKDSVVKIRAQFTMSLLPPDYYEATLELRSVFEDTKPKFKVGNNTALVQEVNNSYKDRIWKVCEIAVFEGGMIDGRIDMMSWLFPNNKGGSLVIEDLDYYP